MSAAEPSNGGLSNVPVVQLGDDWEIFGKKSGGENFIYLQI